MSAWMYSMMWPICGRPLAYGRAVVTNRLRFIERGIVSATLRERQRFAAVR